MAFALRVVITPPAGASNGKSSVLGGVLSLQQFGSGKSQAERAQSSSAKLTFHTAFFEKVANNPSAGFSPLASLEGSLTLEGIAGQPVFTLAEDTELLYLAEVPGPGANEGQAHDDPEPLSLRLAYERANFRGKLPQRLKLPKFPDQAMHLEIGLQLEIDGKEEAAVVLNDHLDVPLSGLGYFKAILKDDTGEPFAQEPFVLEFSDGAKIEGRTDAEGRAIVNPAPRGNCRLHLKQQGFSDTSSALE